MEMAAVDGDGSSSVVVTAGLKERSDLESQGGGEGMEVVGRYLGEESHKTPECSEGHSRALFILHPTDKSCQGCHTVALYLHSTASCQGWDSLQSQPPGQRQQV